MYGTVRKNGRVSLDSSSSLRLERRGSIHPTTLILVEEEGRARGGTIKGIRRYVLGGGYGREASIGGNFFFFFFCFASTLFPRKRKAAASSLPLSSAWRRMITRRAKLERFFYCTRRNVSVNVSLLRAAFKETERFSAETGNFFLPSLDTSLLLPVTSRDSFERLA